MMTLNGTFLFGGTQYADFAVERRGYCREEVNEYLSTAHRRISQLESELLALHEQTARVRKSTAELTAREPAPDAEADASPPSHLLDETEREDPERPGDTQTELGTVRNEALARIEETLHQAEQRADRVTADSKSAAEELSASAEREAEELLAGADREAAAIAEAAEAESRSLFAAATELIEQVRGPYADRVDQLTALQAEVVQTVTDMVDSIAGLLEFADDEHARISALASQISAPAPAQKDVLVQ